MSETIQETVKLLIQQCKIESLSSTDLIKELSNLFDKVSFLEKDNINKQEKVDRLIKEKFNLEEHIAELKKEFVYPAMELKKKTDSLEREKFKFDIEKEYKDREVVIYKEFVRCLTASHTFSESYNAGQASGAYHHKSQNVDKPSFPSRTEVKFGDEK